MTGSKGLGFAVYQLNKITDIAPYPFHGEEKFFSNQVDQWLGLNIENTELLVSNMPDQELWKSVPISTMLTPYPELRKMMIELNPWAGSTIADLGAGYGRLGFIIGAFYPLCNFIGIEISPHRVGAAQQAIQKWSLHNCQMFCGDLSIQKPPEADFYFIYDYGIKRAIDFSISCLREKSHQKKIIVCGRGGAVRDIIEKNHPWLSGVFPAKHYKNFSIYQSSFVDEK